MRRSRPAFRTAPPQMGPQAPSRFRPNMPQVPPRNPQMGRPNMPQVPPRNPQMGGGLAAMAPEQIQAIRDRQARGMAPQGAPNPNAGAALSFMKGTPMQAKPPGLKKGGKVKAKTKGKGASRADGCVAKGRTKGRMV